MSVFDIGSLDLNTLHKDEKFLVDTNILLFLHTDYPQTNPHSSEYTEFVADLISRGIALYTTTGNLQEMLNKIIRKEEELYVKNYKRNHPDEKVFKKMARQDSHTRENIKAIATVAVQQVYNTYTVLQTDISKETMRGYLSNFSTLRYDMMDCFIAQTAADHSLHNIITADPDFQCDERFDIFCFSNADY